MSEWINCTLGDIAEVIGGGTPAKSKIEYYEGGTIPWITPKDLSGYPYRYIERGENNITELGLAKSSARMLPKGTVLFSSRAPIGYVAIAKNPLCTNQGFKNFICDEKKVNNLFLYYFLKNNVPMIENMANGSTFKEISGSVAKTIPISLPPLHIQEKIVSIIGSLDDKIELNLKMNKTLEEMAMTLYKHWFVDFGPFQDGEFVESELGMIPENWISLTFGDLFEIVNDSIDPLQLEEEIPYIGLEHMPKGSISLSEWGISSQVNSNKNRYKKFDILFGKLRPYFKKVGIAPNDGICSTDIMVFRPKDDTHYGLLLGTVIQNSFIEYCTNASSGTKMPRVNWSEIKKYPIFIPNDNTLIIEFNSKIIKWAKIIIENIQENKYLADLRDYLLPRLLSGEIDLSHAEKQVEEVL